MIEPDNPLSVGILVVLFGGYVFFAMAKEAIISMRRSRRHQLAAENNPTALTIEELAENYFLLQATEKLVLTTLGLVMVILAVLTYTVPLAALLDIRETLASALIVAMTIFALVFFGELIPREIARHYAESIALSTVGLIKMLSYLAMPLAGLVVRLCSPITRHAHTNGESHNPNILTEEDLLAYMSASEEEGAIKEDEREMIHSIFSLDDTMAREIMVPRVDIVAININATVSEALDLIIEQGHSRLPVYEEHIDNVKGILYAKDLLAYWRDGGTEGSIASLLREAYYVPETKPVSELLRELQTKKVQIATVVDEYGGMAGIVTIEDILEEIVGEIQDEYDSEEFYMEYISDDEYIFNARMDLDDVNNIMSINLPTEDSDTLGGLVYNILGRVPEVGDTLERDNFRLTVLAIDGRRIKTVKVRRLHPADETSASRAHSSNEREPSPFVGKARNAVSES